MPKQKLNCWDLFDQVQSMIETRQDNDMTNCTSAVYSDNKIELLWPIKLSAICDKNQTGQRHDQL